jgi:hypothetical protein
LIELPPRASQIEFARLRVVEWQSRDCAGPVQAWLLQQVSAIGSCRVVQFEPMSKLLGLSFIRGAL